MRYFRHQLQHNSIPSNQDEVIGHAILPSDCQLNGVQGQVHCQMAATVPFNRAVMYACDGWVIPVDDPDTVDVIDDIWDRFVEKDNPATSFDLDTASADTISFDEPGTPNSDRIAGLGELDQSKRFFRRRKLMTFQSIPRGFIDATPDTYIPGDVFNVKVRRRMSVDEFSIAMFGFGSPAFTSVTTTHPSSPTETQWLQLKYAEVVLEQAWMDIAGLTEAGAETPWEEATALIVDMLEPVILEDTAGAFNNDDWDVFSQFTWDLSVPGRRNFSAALTAAS